MTDWEDLSMPNITQKDRNQTPKSLFVYYV